MATETPSYRETFQQGDVIFEEGAESTHAFVINSGSVEISRTIGDKKIVFGTLKKGAIFGEMALINNLKRTATATAVDDTELVVVDKNILSAFMEKTPGIIVTIVNSLINRLLGADERLSFSTNDNIFLSICQVLNIFIVNELKIKSSNNQAHDQSVENTVAISLNEVILEIRNIFSVPVDFIKTVFETLESFKIIAFEWKGKEKYIVINNTQKFIEQCREVY